MKTSIKVTGLIAAGAVWALATACLSPPVEHPPTIINNTTPVSTRQTAQNKVDILFMVDNSRSMGPMQMQLQQKFSQFLQVFANLASGPSPQYADMHIAVVTSDYGAGSANTAGSNCAPSPGPGGTGQGLFQTGAGVAGCTPPSGQNFISFAFGAANNTCNLGMCDSNTLNQVFTCMASVGANGCGFEHQLEAVYNALNPPPGSAAATTNAGFLRKDALLAVVFVTNEDDGSVPPGSDVFTGPANNANVGTYGAYDTYRQTHFGVACMGQLTPPGLDASFPGGSLNAVPLMNCQPANNAPGNMTPNVAEYDVSRYTQFFTKPGVLKDDPLNNIILVGIDGPDQGLPMQNMTNGLHPIQLVSAAATGNAGGTTGPYVACSPIDTTNNTCVARIDHTCQNLTDATFFADPGIRLNTVIRNQHLRKISSICGDDGTGAPTQPPDYTKALQDVANLIVSSLQPSCINARLLGANGQPNAVNPACSVEDIDSNGIGHPMPQCLPSGNTVYPCWKVQPSTQCTMSPDKVQIVIDRNGQPAPAGTNARVECQTCDIDPATGKCPGQM